MKRYVLLLMLIAALPLLPGCWDIKSLHDTNYITAFGLDYKNEHYVIYAQMIDFSSVAKQQPGKSGQNSQVWTGYAEGDTLSQAISNLYRTSQQKVMWAHVSAIVLTEAALKQDLRSFMDGTIRFGETRYTQWIFGTKEPLGHLFSVIPFFNLSPLSSILHHPKQNYEQRSMIQPIQLNQVLAEVREPGYTLLLPSLSVSEGVWKRNEKNDPKLEVNGVFAIQDNKLETWVQESHLSGLRWLNPDTDRAVVVARQDGKPSASLTLNAIKPMVITDIVGDRATFSVHVRCEASINEFSGQTDETAIQQGAARQISEEIRHTWAYGKAHNVDLLHLEHHLYWDNFSAWSRLTMNGNKPLRDYTLKSVDVDVRLIHSGMNKLLLKAQEQGQDPDY